MRFLILSLIFLISEIQISIASERFTAKSDTLIVQTTKFKGTGLFKVGAGNVDFKDTIEWKGMERFKFYPNYHIVYPEQIKEMKLGFFSLMFDSLRYFDKVTGKKEFQQNFSIKDRVILMVTGFLHDKEVLIVDENHNCDLRDDSIRAINNWVWDSNKNLIMCKYTINKGSIMVNDSGWFRIGRLEDNLLISSSQHFYADFMIDKNTYSLGVCDKNASSFCTYAPILCLFSENKKSIDTLIKSNIVHLGEYVKLGESYYKFESFYNGSGTIALVREPNFNDLTGTQVGMKFPKFKCLTTDGDTLYDLNLIKDKPLLIANISNCTPKSYDVFKNLNKACRNQLSIIGLEYKIDKNPGGIMVDVEKDFNKDIYNKYRNALSSYDCYLIDKNGRIIDMFDLFKWESNLAKYKY